MSGAGPAARVEISLAAVASNARAIRRRAPGRGLIAVLKRDGYGHGAVRVARALSGLADWLAVADVEEGAALRTAGSRARILLLTPPAGRAEARRAARLMLMPTLTGEDGLAAPGVRRGPGLEAHLKFDTGMGRLGARWERAAAVAAALRRRGVRRLAGTWTHLASADSPAATAAQLARFDACLAALRAAGVEPGLTHAANSEAILAGRALRYGAVRPGLLLYGCRQGRECPPAPFRPAMAWRARVLAVRELPAGQAVSYGGTWRTRRRTRLAVLPVGYANGFARLRSNRGAVLVRGRRAPVRGRVCMNLTLADVTAVPAARPGDVATLLGMSGRARISAETAAREEGSVAYELLCTVGGLNPRSYFPGGGR